MFVSKLDWETSVTFLINKKINFRLLSKLITNSSCGRWALSDELVVKG